MNDPHANPVARSPHPSWYWTSEEEDDGEVAQTPGAPPLGVAPSSPANAGGATTMPIPATSPTPGMRSLHARRRLTAWQYLGVLLGLLLLATLGSLSGSVLGRLGAARLHAVSTPTILKGRTSTPPLLTPAVQGRSQPTPRPSPAGPVRGTPVPSPTASPAILSQDDFARPDQPGWGFSSDGERWSGEANGSAAFAIRAHAGQIEGGAGLFTALLGPQVTDTDVSASGMVTRFADHEVNLGIVVRYQNAANYVKAYLDGEALILMQRVAERVRLLDAAPFVAQAGISYTLRLRAVGTLLLAKAWQSEDPEPTQWQVFGQDAAPGAGMSGMRVLLVPGVTITISAFVERRTA
jgi:hypothetical protein